MPRILPLQDSPASRDRGAASLLFELSVEVLIDGARLVLAALALLTIMIDPVATSAGATAVRNLLIAYLVFATVLVAVPADRKRSARLQFALHAVDIAVFSVLMHFSEGATGRFFPLYNFALIAATLRWSWRGALATAFGLIALMLLTIVFDSAASSTLSHLPTRLIMRGGYLLVAGAMLACLGAYLDKSRDRLAQLAAWPREDIGDGEAPAIAASLAHATAVLASREIVVAWETGDEPFLKTARSTETSCQFAGHPNRRLSDVVAREVAELSFHAAHPGAVSVFLPCGSRLLAEAVVADDFARSFASGGFGSAPFAGRDLSGRIFIFRHGPFSPGLLHLCEIVAARIGAELEQFGLRSALANATKLRERARLARDLHDGLLQELTDARLSIKSLTQSAAEPMRADLDEIAAMLGDHQRRIRDFVKAANPKPGADWDFGVEFLTLTAMLERQWQCQVVAAFDPPGIILPGNLGYQVFLIFGEAMANAVQHGHARRIAVAIARQDRDLHMHIADDGSGLPQRSGNEAPGPFSLRQRVADLGGRLKLASSAKGVELTIELPIP